MIRLKNLVERRELRGLGRRPVHVAQHRDALVHAEEVHPGGLSYPTFHRSFVALQEQVAPKLKSLKVLDKSFKSFTNLPIFATVVFVTLVPKGVPDGTDPGPQLLHRSGVRIPPNY